jgi:hypothetical protein
MREPLDGHGLICQALSMERVSFISTEISDLDFMVSFAVETPSDPTEIESLMVLRSPKFEFVFDDDERGAKVSFERHREDEDDWLEEVRYAPKDQTVFLKTRKRSYLLDLRKVDAKELYQMRKVFRKMNFDRRLRLSGI